MGIAAAITITSTLSLRYEQMVKSMKEAKAKHSSAKAKCKAAVRLNLLAGTRARSKAVAKQRTASSASSGLTCGPNEIR